MDIFLDILLKPPQPLMGLFLSIFLPQATAERVMGGGLCMQH